MVWTWSMDTRKRGFNKVRKELFLRQNDIFLCRDHYVSVPTSCQAKHTLFRWKNSSIRLFNVAFVKSQIQNYFMDQFQVFQHLCIFLNNWKIFYRKSIHPNGFIQHIQLIHQDCMQTKFVIFYIIKRYIN